MLGRVTIPNSPPLAVFYGLAAHLGDVSLGGPEIDDLTHLADLVIHPGGVTAVFKKWVVPRVADGLVIQQCTGPIRVRLGRFPP
jgi:hypothetical protein